MHFWWWRSQCDHLILLSRAYNIAKCTTGTSGIHHNNELQFLSHCLQVFMLQIWYETIYTKQIVLILDVVQLIGLVILIIWYVWQVLANYTLFIWLPAYFLQKCSNKWSPCITLYTGLIEGTFSNKIFSIPCSFVRCSTILIERVLILIKHTLI